MAPRTIFRLVLAYVLAFAILVVFDYAMGIERSWIVTAVFPLLAPIGGLVSLRSDWTAHKRGWRSLAFAVFAIVIGWALVITQTVTLWNAISFGHLSGGNETVILWSEAPLNFLAAAAMRLFGLLMGAVFVFVGVDEFWQWRETRRLTRPLANR